MAMLQKFLTGLGHLIFPHNCLLCKKHLSDRETGVLCRTCYATIETNKPPFCSRCSRHINRNPESDICTQCARTVYFFDRAWGVAIYNDTMKELIHLFKYRQRLALRKTFAELIAAFIEEYRIDIGQFDAVVPVPLHPSRLRERGYNQSQLIAEDISKTFNIKALQHNLVRIRPTRNQALLKKKERWTNIRGAFKIMNPFELKGKSVLVIDDLLTTGATISEAAHAVKAAGAKQIAGLTLAIAQ